MATEPHFEVFPEISTEAPTMGAPTGEFVWHFQGGNGDITFTGGESFTRREDAHRSIYTAVLEVGDMLSGVAEPSHQLSAELRDRVRIVDLDADGEPIAEE